MGFMHPVALGPLGLQPETVDFEGINRTGGDVTQGQWVILDIRAEGTYTAPEAHNFRPGDTASAYANLYNPSNGDSYLNYAIGAVYLSKTDGTIGTLAAGERGIFRLKGHVRASVINISATSPGTDAAVGDAIQGTSSKNLGVTPAMADGLNSGIKILGWALEAVAFDDGTTPTSPLVSIYFNGEGCGIVIPT